MQPISTSDIVFRAKQFIMAIEFKHSGDNYAAGNKKGKKKEEG
jgi:hypothetical protein